MRAGFSSSFEALLQAAIEAPAGEVDRVIAECDDPRVRQRVRGLLDAEGALGSFLEPRRPVPPAPASFSHPSVTAGATMHHIRHRSSPANAATSEVEIAGVQGLRRRLQLVGWAISALCFAQLLLLALQAVQVEEIEPVLAHEAVFVGALATISLTLVALLRRGFHHQLVHFGLFYLFATCGLLGAIHAAHELRVYAVVTGFGPHILITGFSPLVLFESVRRTVITTSASVLFALISIVGMVVWATSEPWQMINLPELAAGAAMGVTTAVIVARNIVRLRAKIERARRLGSYHLEEKLGEGGMGEVWRATHQLLARPTAVKLIRPRHAEGSAAKQQTMVDRFTREARATASLRSPHTVDLYDFGVSREGTFFIAMELIEGIDLHTLVTCFGPQHPERVRQILLQACDSLAEAHDLGLVHRDIKPANLMVCRQGRQVEVVKVLDFGIVALVARPEESGITIPGGILGTPTFMAPEAMAHGASDPRADLYALGCVAYWLLTGRYVFDHQSPAKLIAAHLRDTPLPPSGHGFDIPRDLEAVVLRCLGKQPEERFRSADHLARHLARCAPGSGWGPESASIWWQQHFPLSEPGAPTVDEGLRDAASAVDAPTTYVVSSLSTRD